MPASTETSSATTEKSSATSLDRLSELAWKAIPAIGGAIGFVGFVSTVGAALLWLRFHTAGLPATQALLAVPRQELVITGGWELSIAILGGLLASLLVYLFDSKGDANANTAYGITLVATLEMGTILVAVHLSLLDTILFFVAVVAIGIAGGFALGEYTTHFTKRRELKRLRRVILATRDPLVAAIDAAATKDVKVSHEQMTDALNERRVNARLDLATARHSWKRAIAEWDAGAIFLARPKRALLVEVSRSKVDEAVKDDLHPPSELELRPLLRDVELQLGNPVTVLWESFRTLKLARKLILIASAVLFVVAVTAATLSAPATAGWIAIPLLAAVVLAVTNLFVAHGTKKFLWYGVAVFFSVVVFGAVLEIVYTFENKRVQPVALLRKNNTAGLCGVFVAQTSERVYVGRLPYSAAERPGLIFWVPSSEVDIVSVGQLAPISTLQQHATAMLTRLYRDRSEEPPPTLKNETTTTVTGAEVPAGARTGTQKTVVSESRATKYNSSPRPAGTANTCGAQPDPAPPKRQLPTHRLQRLAQER